MIFRAQRKKKKRDEIRVFTRRYIILSAIIILIVSVVTLLFLQENHEPLPSIPQAITHAVDMSAVHEIALSPDRNMLAIATDAGVWLQEINALEEEPKLLTAITMGTYGKMEVAFRSDTELVVFIRSIPAPNTIISHHSKLQVWDVTSGMMVHQEPPPGTISTMEDSILTESGELIEHPDQPEILMQSNTSDPNMWAMSPEKEWLFMNLGDGYLSATNNSNQPTVAIYDIAIGSVIAEFMTGVPAQKVALDSANQYIALDHQDQISVWELSSQEKVNTLTDVINNFGFTADGRLIVETVRGEVALMDVVTSEQEVLLSYDSISTAEPIIYDVILRDDRWVIVSTSSGVDIWDVSINQPYYSFVPTGVHCFPVRVCGNNEI